MSNTAHTVRDARTTWSSPLPFDPYNGGQGILLTATSTSGTSSRTALVGDGFTARCHNPGTVAASVALGDSDVTATLLYLRLGPGETEYIVLRPEITFTHAAAITAAGETTIQITRGYGGAG